MHPDIGDLIQGIKRTLSEEVLPAIGNSFAREQLAYTLFLCEHLGARWDQAHIFVAQEYADLRSTLAAAVDLGRRCTKPGANFTALLDTTAVALAAEEPADGRSLRTLSATSAELKGTVVRLLEACEEASPADRDVLADLCRTLRALMKRQLAREEEWVKVGQIGWW